MRKSQEGVGRGFRRVNKEPHTRRTATSAVDEVRIGVVKGSDEVVYYA